MDDKIIVEDPERDLGIEYCEFCEQNFPVKVRIVSNLDAGVHLQISGFHIHMSMSGDPIPLAARLIRIDDMDDFRTIGKLLKAEIIRVSKEVEARDALKEEQPVEEVCSVCGEALNPDEAA